METLSASAHGEESRRARAGEDDVGAPDRRASRAHDDAGSPAPHARGHHVAGNAHFYKGRLQAHEAVAHATLDGLRPWLWVDTAGCGFEERRSEEGGSVSNRDEAAFALDRAVEWLQNHPAMTLGIVALTRRKWSCSATFGIRGWWLAKSPPKRR